MTLPPPPPGYIAYAPPAPSGRMSWALGFLAYIPIPAFSLIIAAIVMWAAYPARSRNSSALVRDNARNAANWGITLLIGMVILAIYYFVMLSMEWARTAGFFPIGATIIGFLALAIVHLIVTIMGTVAGATRVFRGPGIPFLRG